MFSGLELSDAKLFSTDGWKFLKLLLASVVFGEFAGHFASDPHNNAQQLHLTILSCSCVDLQ